MSTHFIGSVQRQKENAASVRSPKTAELIARRIRNAIIRGELKDGDSLPTEARLILEFEVSRPTIREAIRILESENLLKVVRGARGGASVISPSYDMIARAAGITLQSKGVTVADLYEMRTLVEPPAARLVAERNSEEAARLLKAQLDLEYSLIHDRPAIALAIARFHQLLIELSGNQTLTMIAHALLQLVERHQEIAHLNEPVSDEAQLERRTRFGLKSHAKLIEHIERGDGEGAEQHWRAHMRAAGEFWLSAVGRNALVDLLD